MRAGGSSFEILACRTLSNTDTRGAPKGTFTKNHPGNTGREAGISFVLESPPGNSVVDTLKGSEGKR